MEVGNGRKVFSYQAPIKSVEPFNAMVFALQVGAHKAYVGSQSFEEHAGKGPTEHGDA